MAYKTRRARTEDFVGSSGRGGHGGDNSVERSGELGRAREVSVPDLVVFTALAKQGCELMAASWFLMLADVRKARAVVASRRPAARVDPHLAQTLREAGADIKAITVQPLTSELLKEAALIVTMGGSYERSALGTETPIHREHWMVEPEHSESELVGRTRSLSDLIRSRVAMLVFTEGWGRADISRDEARVTRPHWHHGVVTRLSRGLTPP